MQYRTQIEHDAFLYFFRSVAFLSLSSTLSAAGSRRPFEQANCGSAAVDSALR